MSSENDKLGDDLYYSIQEYFDTYDWDEEFEKLLRKYE
jgi:hypothetical protein